MTTNSQCPPEWRLSLVRNGILCYGYQKERLSFSEATDKCKHVNSSLVSIHSIADNNFVSHLVSGETSWMGLVSSAKQTNESAAEGNRSANWVWMDGSALDIELWGRGGWFFDGSVPPKCPSSCCTAFMDEDGMWNHAACGDSHSKHGYVCQRPLSLLGNDSDWRGMEAMVQQLLQISDQMRRQEETTRVLVTALDAAELKDMQSLKRVGEEVTECKKLLLVAVVLVLASGLAFFVTVCRRGFSSQSSTTTGFEKMEFACGNECHENEDEEELVQRV